MKRFFYAAVFVPALILSSCGSEGHDVEKAKQDSIRLADSFAALKPKPMPDKMHSDLNFVDADGKKQGKWIIYGKMSGDAAFNPTAKFEEGTYKDNAKEGEWTEYNPDGSVKRTVNFHEGNEVK